MWFVEVFESDQPSAASEHDTSSPTRTTLKSPRGYFKVYYLLVDGGLDHGEVGVVLGRPAGRDHAAGRDLDGRGRLEAATVVEVGACDEAAECISGQSVSQSASQ